MGSSVRLHREQTVRWRNETNPHLRPLKEEEPKAPPPPPISAPTGPRDPALAVDARTCHLADASAARLRGEAEAKLPKPRDTSRPPGEPFKPISEGDLDRLLAKVDDTGNLAALDTVDNFRQTLTPELQAEYDRQLAQLREDPRLVFDYQEGATPSAAEEDLARRGILASTFGNPALLESTLGNSSHEDGKVHIRVYPSSFPLDDFHPGNESHAPGLATPDGGIAIAQDFYRDVLQRGDNPFVHEFGHLTQRPGAHAFGADTYPSDFPFSEEVQKELESPEFQSYLVDRFFGGAPQEGPVHTGAEGWPTLLNLYRQYPEELSQQSPEIYRAMSDYFGYDPVQGRQAPPIQLNGRGDLSQSATALDRSFGALAGGDGRIDRAELERALADRSLPPEARQAAAQLLSSRSSYAAADVGAGRGDVDGDISQRDLAGLSATIAAAPRPQVQGAVDTRAEAESVLQAYGYLADTAAGRGGRDEHVSDRDLRALVSDPGAPPELRQAAVYTLVRRAFILD